MFEGRIYCYGNYGDGAEIWEIPVMDFKHLPYKQNGAIKFPIYIDNTEYIATIRHTAKNGCWITRYLFLPGTNEKLRLSEVLQKQGFVRKERVELIVKENGFYLQKLHQS